MMFRREKEQYIEEQRRLFEKQKRDYSCTIACLQHQLEERDLRAPTEDEKDQQAVIINRLHLFNKELTDRV
jgi:hypothetical protein